MAPQKSKRPGAYRRKMEKERQNEGKTKALTEAQKRIEYLKASKFPKVTNLYTEGWNDVLDYLIKEAKRNEGKTHS